MKLTKPLASSLQGGRLYSVPLTSSQGPFATVPPACPWHTPRPNYPKNGLRISALGNFPSAAYVQRLSCLWAVFN